MALDRERELQRLSEADRHIVEAEAAVTKQIAEIEKLRRDGHNTLAAEELLKNFERSLEVMHAHRQEIISTIDEIDKGVI
jgi:Cdc6-like AAA superfamily ATPase